MEYLCIKIANQKYEIKFICAKNIVVEKIDPAYDITRAAELQKELHFDGNDHLARIALRWIGEKCGARHDQQIRLRAVRA